MTAAPTITDDDVLAPLRVLAAHPSPNGAERPLAEAVAAWGRAAIPDAEWEVDALDAQSANLFARSRGGGRAPELVLYGHLDTSLTGDAARDEPVTGVATPPPALVERDRTVRGFGIGVAKAPSAAAIAAFAAATRALRDTRVPHTLTLLLAAGGTHRAAPSGSTTRFGHGVEHALAKGWRPDAVLNVKSGPRGVLREEPAAAYLRVTLRSSWDAVLVRRVVAPDGGLARHAGAIIDAVEEWRGAYLAAHPPTGQLAPEIAIGALRAGSPEKPDLLPGLLELYVYAVLLPDADVAQVARDLEATLAPRAKALPRSPRVSVDVYAYAPGGTTAADEPIVRIASAAWRDAFGDTGAVREWSGATDGAIFLARGIPTARMGPPMTRDAADPRIEILSLDDLAKAARAYAAVATGFFASPRSAT